MSWESLLTLDNADEILGSCSENGHAIYLGVVRADYTY